MITNPQPSTTEPKKTKTKIGTESQKWRLQGRLSAGWGRGEKGGKGTGNKMHK